MTTHTIQKGETLWLIAKSYNISLKDLILANPQIQNPNNINIGMMINIPGVSGSKNGKEALPSKDYSTQHSKKKNAPAKDYAAPKNKEKETTHNYTPPKKTMPEISLQQLMEKENTTPQYQPSNQGNTIIKEMLYEELTTIPLQPPITIETPKPAQPKKKCPQEQPQAQIIQPPQQMCQSTNKEAPLIYIIQKGDTLHSIAQYFGININTLLNCNCQIPDINNIGIGEKLFIPRPKKQPRPNNQQPTVCPHCGNVINNIPPQ